MSWTRARWFFTFLCKDFIMKLGKRKIGAVEKYGDLEKKELADVIDSGKLFYAHVDRAAAKPVEREPVRGEVTGQVQCKHMKKSFSKRSRGIATSWVGIARVRSHVDPDLEEKGL